VRAPGRLLIRPAPEQFGLFGGVEPMYQITRTVRGQPESILVSQSQFDKLRKDNASVDRAMRRSRSRLAVRIRSRASNVLPEIGARRCREDQRPNELARSRCAYLKMLASRKKN
jgi:hypothetical protein